MRKQQGLLRADNWEETRQLVDMALDGLIHRYITMQHPLAQLGLEIQLKDKKQTAWLELAWPALKQGIATTADDREIATIAGWQVLSIGEALKVTGQI
jgi:hypothetical protein